MSARDVLRGARAATVFLTRIPAGGFPFTPEEWRWASAWLPAVGALVGCIMGAVWMVSSRLGPVPAALLAYAAGVLTTGAFHEDGLADTADALGGGSDRDAVFRILKDSRVGTYGAVALILSFGLRVGLLERAGLQAPLALLLSQCVSRTPAVWLLAGLPYVTPEADSRGRVLARATWHQALVATIWPALLLGVAGAAGLLGPMEIGLIIVVVAAVGALCAWRFSVRMGGVTGDFLGATQQISEIAVLLTLVAGWVPVLRL